MKTQSKIEYINSVNERFLNARNHGHNGNNWWYPKANVIAYNVKIYGRSKDISDFRKAMTKRQNEYYTEDGLYSIANDMLNMECEMLQQDVVIEMKAKDAHFAGRSGDWFEVEYENTLQEVSEENDKKEIDYYYEEARKLEKQEAEIEAEIKRRHSSLTKYQNTDAYVKDFVDNLLDDEMIGDIYKGRIKDNADKLK